MSNITEMRNLPEELIEYRRTQTSVTGETTDFYPGFRGTASHSRDLLFPGMAPHNAFYLWTQTFPTFTPENLASLCTRPRLYAAAVRFAKAVRKPKNYFTSTEFFREQCWYWKRNWIRGIGLEALFTGPSRLRSLARSEA
ncbi:MAG: hypothetical protein JO108_03690 [Acidobacteriaceae bacterium]|nr:hypothetical protein [Acidobacteriaceae bacterium]